MPKFGTFRANLNFGFKKVIFWLYHSDTIGIFRLKCVKWLFNVIVAENWIYGFLIMFASNCSYNNSFR